MKEHSEIFESSINGHAIGIIMKELVRRALEAIRNQQQVFEVTAKRGHSGKMDDMLTSADKAAQEVYIRSLRECFPNWGIVAEEDNLMVECADGSGYYFTVDPLDGTKAFVRRQSHGVGTMISLIRVSPHYLQRYVAAYVGDVNTREIYGFRPNSESVHRITEFNLSEKLKVPKVPLKRQYVLLRDPVNRYSLAAQSLVGKSFKNHMIDGSSIGTWMARLWKGEVGAVILPPSTETPWDANPVNAISQKLGFVFLEPYLLVTGRILKTTKWRPVEVFPQTSKYVRRSDMLVVHKNNLHEIPLAPI